MNRSFEIMISGKADAQGSISNWSRLSLWFACAGDLWEFVPRWR